METQPALDMKKTNSKGAKSPVITLPREGSIGDRLALHAHKAKLGGVIEVMASTPTTMAIEPGDIPQTRVAMSDVFIIPGFNVRHNFGDIKGLAASIKERGLDNSLTVIKKTFGKRTVYGILAGERRFRALIKLGATHVSVRAFEGSAEQAAHLRDLENFQRLDLSHWEKAELCAALREGGLKLNAVAKRLGRSPSWVSNQVAIVTKLDPAIYALWKKYPNAVKLATRICRLPHAEQAKEWNAWIRANEDPKKGKRKSQRDKSATLSRKEIELHINALWALLKPGNGGAAGAPFMSAATDDFWSGALFGLQLTQGKKFSTCPKKFVAAYVAAEKKLNKARARTAAKAAKEAR
jgi:ParB/RepB/Spo0J family partition protein